MSRRDEVEKDIVWIESGGLDAECEQWPELARTLADEVDERDAVITRLLAMLEPDDAPKPEQYEGYDQLFRERSCRWNDSNKRYARACEIAGRKE